jgi:hypothetical protein
MDRVQLTDQNQFSPWLAQSTEGLIPAVNLAQLHAKRDLLSPSY